MSGNIQLMQGNEACALGAIKAGATFFGGYPITPSTEIAEYIAREFPRLGRYFMQMEDEIYEEDFLAGFGKTGGEINGGCGFAYAAFLISDSNNSSHMKFLSVARV